VSRIGAAVAVIALAIVPRSMLADSNVDPSEEKETPSEEAPAPTWRDSELCSTRDGVVGRRHCPRYGAWGAPLEAPYMVITFGVNIRHLPPDPETATSRSTVSTAAESAGNDPSYSFMEQIAISLTRFMHLGLEIEISPTGDETPPGRRTYAAGSQLVFGLHGSTRLLKLGIELAGGGRIVDTHRANGGQEEVVLEARARGDLWLTPWLTVGGAIGKSLIDPNDWVMGMYVGAHSYSFGGP